MQKSYHKALVLFIDILGSQNRSNFEELLEINTIFHNELEKNQNMDKDYNVTQRHIYTFSDCSYIIYDFKEGVDEDRKDIGNLIFQALYNTEQLIQKLLRGNFIFRGGVAYGDVYYEEGRSLIFGDAINRAYQLESKEAKYPRIVVDDFVAEKLIEFNENLLNSTKEKLKGHPSIFIENMKQIYGNIILRDENYDNRYHLNYLNSIKQGFNHVESVELVESLKRIANEEIDKYKVNPDDDEKVKANKEKIIEKYEWLLKYIESYYPEDTIVGILFDLK